MTIPTPPGRYEWRPGVRFSGDADSIGRALDEIRARQPLTAESVVDAARSPDSPLHPLIEWDDRKAARLHRIETGRRIIRGLAFVVVEKDREVRRVAFHNVPAERPGEFGEYLHPWEPMTVDQAERAYRLLSTQLAGAQAALRDLEASIDVPGSSWASRAPKVAELRRWIDGAGEAAAKVTQEG